MLWRIVHDDHDLLRREVDADVSIILQMEKADRSAAPFVPPLASIANLQEAAKACTGCDLYRNATQTVFGQGPQGSRLALVGEQPGDQLRAPDAEGQERLYGLLRHDLAAAVGALRINLA